MNMKKVAALLVLTVAAVGALAQCKEFKWPENKAKAEECVAIYGDALKQGNYRGATAALQWMLTNAPNWHNNLYINGADIYDKLAEKETDPAKKQVLVDSLMWIYDQRIKNCGEEPSVLNRKANALFKYDIKNKDKVANLLGIYDKVYELNGNNVTDPSIINYMTVVKSNVVYLKNLSEDQILQRYDKISTVIDFKTKKAQEANKTADVEKYKTYKATVDDMLITMVKVDCEFVKKNLEPKFKANPSDATLAKKMFGFMLQGKCTDDPLWLEVGEVVHKTEQDFGLAKTLGIKYLSIDNTARAEELLKESLSLAKDQTDKAEVLSYLGSIEAKKGNKIGARDLFRQALAADPNYKEAYEKIGDLYINSFSDCSKKESMAQDRLVYIAAYEEYAKAGNSQKMASAKAQFPSVEDIFLLNWKAGESKSTGCWIGTTVTLRTRD
jgi:tetratricopeptide (TPR) repeat protein